MKYSPSREFNATALQEYNTFGRTCEVIIFPYEVWVAQNILSFSFDLPAEMVAAFTENEDRGNARIIGSFEDYADDNQEDFTEGEQDGQTRDEDDIAYEYALEVGLMRDRLDVMGCTTELWRAELLQTITARISSARESLSEYEPSEKRRRWRALRTAERIAPEDWVRTLMRLIRNRWDGVYTTGESVAEELLFDDSDVLLLPFSSELLFLRAAIDMHEDSDIVKFEYGAALMDDDSARTRRFTEEARTNLVGPARSVEKILILTEGKSDSRLLSRSVERLCPHVAHMYSFLDHSSFRAPGGVGELERLVRGFAAAGVSNRVVVLFDNDTAGHAAATRLKKTLLPDNFRVLTLPHLEIAMAYPTIGPTGPSRTDVNGTACPIELYCGLTALSDDHGDLRPIQWTGYDQSLQRYQGEPLCKDVIQQRYLAALTSSTDPALDREFDCMRSVLRVIMAVRW